MSIDENLAFFFKPEDRSRGEQLVAKDLVVISGASDTSVRAFIKASAACKVSLTASEVASLSFDADCSCTAARKGNLCKHIWAVLVKLDEKESDFLEGKQCIEKISATSPARAATNARLEEFKKQGREKQKARAKDMRREKKKAEAVPAYSYPVAVENARIYFEGNGFPLPLPIELDALINAKRLLSRVFHPDKGGTHDETITLNRNFDLIYGYLKS